MRLRTLTTLATLGCASLALTAGAPATSGAKLPAAAGAGTSWILLTSDREGTKRTYSVGLDGSRLTPLLPPDRHIEPVAVSPDRSTIVYSDDAELGGAIYVSRADGSGFRRLARKGLGPVFSPNRRLLAFTRGSAIWIVGTNGRGLRRLTARGGPFDWSPDGKALVYMRVIDAHGRYGLVVQPLRRKPRVIARTGPNDDTLDQYEPDWSPDGRWIAYINYEEKERRNGLTLVRPNGKSRHRVVLGAGDEDIYEWSPNGRFLVYQDGTELDVIRPNGDWHRLSADAQALPVWSPDRKKLAFPIYARGKDVVRSDLVVAGADGQGATRLGLGLTRIDEWSFLWSPDGRLVFAGSVGGDPAQIWVVGADGRGLRRLTNEGENDVVGWTPLSPALPPAPPLPATERVEGPTVAVTSTPVAALSADGPRVAFAPRPTATDCVHVMVWAPGENNLQRLGNLPAPCSGGGPRLTPLVLAGSRAAWVSTEVGEQCSFELMTATLADPGAREVSGAEWMEGPLCSSPDIGHLRGDGDTLVFDEEPSHASWLVRIGVAGEKCGQSLCSTLRKDAQGAAVDSVSAGLIATRRPGSVSVLDSSGNVVRAFSFSPADVNGALLDGSRLVVWRFGALEVYDMASGALVLSRPLPTGFRLADVDGGIAVLRDADTITLLRLADGHSLTLTPGQGPVLADLESTGLYYSYATADGGGRVVFVPRSTLSQELPEVAR
jgi:Tol biopolymer transport system component